MFRADELLDLLQLAWSNFRPENDGDLDDRLKLLPQVCGSGELPYVDISGVYSFIEMLFLIRTLSHYLQERLP